MNNYESIIILKPDIVEKEIKEEIEKYKKIIRNFVKKNEEQLKIEEIGKKNLAYEVKQYKQGYYVLFEFYAEIEEINELERKFRKDDDVLKFIIVRKDD